MNMEMTRNELNKMTKRDLIEHSNQYGVHPNRKDIPKGMLIDLIIHHGFNRPPPKREESETEESSEEIKVRPKHWEIKTRIVEFSSEEISKCKTRAEVDELVDKKWLARFGIWAMIRARTTVKANLTNWIKKGYAISI